MNNLFKLIAVLAVFSFVFTACGTPPPPPPEPKPQPVVEEPVPEPVVEKPVPEPMPESVVEVPTDVPLKEYVVVAGDTLSEIALKFYGTREKAYYFPIIMAVNPGIIGHPDRLTPKTKLLIPDYDVFMQVKPAQFLVKSEFKKCIKIYNNENKFGVVEVLKKNLKDF